MAPLFHFEKCRVMKANAPDVSEPFVTLIVGQTKKKFTLSEELLTSHSFYFKTALRNKSREGQEGIVELPEDDENAFELYVRWLFTGKIWSMESPDENIYSEGEEIYPELQFLGLAYCLGERYQDCDFKDAVLDAMKARLRLEPGSAILPAAETIRLIWNNTQPRSPARRLILGIFVWYQSDCPDESELADLDIREMVSGEFFKELAFALLSVYAFTKAPGMEDPLRGPNNCVYHEHTATEKCYKQKHPK